MSESKIRVEAKPKTEDSLADLRSRVGEGKVSDESADRLLVARDLWPRGLIELRFGRPVIAPPRAVVWPESPEDVVRIVEWAAERGAGLVAYGGGSGLCGGATPGRGEVVVDLKRMSRIEWIRPEDHLVRVQAGRVGALLQSELERAGQTLGHFPSSIFCSTVGGWLAARSAGQCSSRYGKIEDMIVSVQAVTGAGEMVETSRVPAAGLGPDWSQIFVGSEGTLGIITAATLKIHRRPETRRYRGYAFSRVSAGLEAARRVMQRGLRPAVVRLYDELDTLLVRSDEDLERAEGGRGVLPKLLRRFARVGDPVVPWLRERALKIAANRPAWLNRMASGVMTRLTGGGCLMIVGHEGDSRLVEADSERCRRELVGAGGVDLGEGPGLHWERNRYSVAFLQSEVFESTGFVDTLETAATWDKVMTLYEEVKRAVSPFAFVMAHFGHVYHEGCAVCFTFVGEAAAREEALERYDRMWEEALGAVIRGGGTISHHHGVGRSRRGHMVEEHGDSLELVRVLKKTLDPMGVLNPGKLVV